MNNKQETAEQFVTRKLTGLTPKKLKAQSPDVVFYVNENDELIVKISNNLAYCRWDGFCNVLMYEYKFDFIESLYFINPILNKILHTNKVSPTSQGASDWDSFERHLKEEGIILENN